jgi:hypothetical protein
MLARIWIKNFLQELGVKQKKYNIFCNRQSAINLAKNPNFHSQNQAHLCEVPLNLRYCEFQVGTT